MDPQASFPKCARIRKRAEYLAVQGRGRKHHSDNFLVFVLPASRPEHAARFGVTVSKKVGGAVTRNRVKRLLREALRRSKARFPSGLEVVWVAKQSSQAAGFPQVEREVLRIARRLGGAP